MTKTVLGIKQVLATLLLSGLMVGCEMPLEIKYCNDLAFTTLADHSITSAVVIAGNRDGRAESPLLTIENPTKVTALRDYLLTLQDKWFLAAGETYDPKSRHAISEFSIDFKNDNTVLGTLGIRPTYLETPGCGFEVVRSLTPAQHARFYNLIFDTPMPVYANP